MGRRLPLAASVIVLVILSLFVYFDMQEMIKGKPNWNMPTIAHYLEDVSRELSCGEICSYSGTCTRRKYYPMCIKSISCNNIFKRMANTSITVQYPPPRKPPTLALEKAFTQNGDNPIKQYMYLVDFNPNHGNVRLKYTKDQMDDFILKDINPYGDKGLLASVLTDYRHFIEGKSALVVGTEKPWLESMFISRGAKIVMTLEYRDLIIEHEKVRVKKPHQMARDILNDRQELFEVGASFSSIEHSGLGRYGDPVNPYGDLEAMAQVWCQMKPGGIFFLSVPVSLDGSSFIVWNAHRIYGSKRLQHLTANWNVLDIREGLDSFHQNVIVLEKTTEDIF